MGWKKLLNGIKKKTCCKSNTTETFYKNNTISIRSKNEKRTFQRLTFEVFCFSFICNKLRSK